MFITFQRMIVDKIVFLPIRLEKAIINNIKFTKLKTV